MGDDPVFPKPRAKGSAYREPARSPVVTSTDAHKKPLVVTRPEPLREAERAAAAEDARALLVPATDERAYWAKERFAARHPRITGAALLLVSSFLVLPVVASRLEGHGFAEPRSTALGSVGCSVALWLLAAKLPIEPNGRPPAWWGLGITACIVVGTVVGLALPF